MSIVTNRFDFSRDFTQLPNEWLNDSRLSYRSRGLLASIMTNKDGWENTIEYLVTHGTEGREAVRSAIRELADYGYLERVYGRSSSGRMQGSWYETRFPTERRETGRSVNREVGKPRTRLSPTNNTKIKKDEVKTNTTYTEAFEEWWASYPRKESKKDASKAYKAAVKKIDTTELLQATRRYAKDMAGSEPRFIKYPGGWLRDERWLDYPTKTADSLTAEEVEAAIGPSNWYPDTSGREFESIAEEQAWVRAQYAEHIKDRQARAWEVINGKAG